MLSRSWLDDAKNVFQVEFTDLSVGTCLFYYCTYHYQLRFSPGFACVSAIINATILVSYCVFMFKLSGVC